MSQTKGFNPHLHTSPQNPYPHTDYRDHVGKLHLKLDESEFLAQKYGVKLEPTDSIPPSRLLDLLRRS